MKPRTVPAPIRSEIQAPSKNSLHISIFGQEFSNPCRTDMLIIANAFATDGLGHA